MPLVKQGTAMGGQVVDIGCTGSVDPDCSLQNQQSQGNGSIALEFVVPSSFALKNMSELRRNV